MLVVTWGENDAVGREVKRDAVGDGFDNVDVDEPVGGFAHAGYDSLLAKLAFGKVDVIASHGLQAAGCEDEVPSWSIGSVDDLHAMLAGDLQGIEVGLQMVLFCEAVIVWIVMCQLQQVQILQRQRDVLQLYDVLQRMSLNRSHPPLG